MIHSGWKVPVLFSTVAAANPLASVPWVAQWKFNNNGNDSVGSNNLTNNNSATFTTGKLGGATGATQLVAASTQYWSLGSNSTIQTGNTSFLLCGWIYLDATGSLGIVGKGSNSIPAREYLVWINTNRVRFEWFNSSFAGHAVQADTFGDLSTSTWYFFAAWYDSVNAIAKVSVNAGTADSVAVTTPPVAYGGGFKIGLEPYGSSSPFDGRIDNICFAKGAGSVPTQAVLDALYNGGAGTETLT